MEQCRKKRLAESDKIGVVMIKGARGESIASGQSPSGKDDILVLGKTPQNLCGGKMAGGCFNNNSVGQGAPTNKPSLQE